MSNPGTSRAADLVAQHVEQIVDAAEKVAQRIKEEASADARREAQRELDSARKEAKAQLENAEKESAQMREQTERAVEGRVAAAEKAAAEVLEEARALHSGMRRLGEVLSDQAERILHDVQAAHRQMQANLRVAPSVESPRRSRVSESRQSQSAADLSESERIIAAAEAARSESEAPPPARRGGNPFDDIDVPSWVARDR